MSTPEPKSTLNRVLRPRALKNLTPGTPDLPRPRRTSAQVHAEKERKEVKKKASATKTKAAKARVDGLREALRREQVDPKTSPGGTLVGPGKTRPTPTAKGTVPKQKTQPKPKDLSPSPTETIESAVDETMLDESTSPNDLNPGDEAMTVDVDEQEAQDPATLDDDFQPPADFRDRKSRLVAVLQRHQQPLGKPKSNSTAPNNSKLLLPKATASTIVNKPRGVSKGWYENDRPMDVQSPSDHGLRHTPSTNSVEDHVVERHSSAERPQPVSAMVHVKTHAKLVAKGKKERASRGLLSDIPAILTTRYLTDFQPSFIHMSIGISSDPWDKLSIDDAQELFTAVFPDVDHEMNFGDVFYSPANQTTSTIRNQIKEAGLVAVHRAMDGLAPTARKHLAGKAERHGKEFPFIYRHYEVTDIPDRHAEGGDAVRREGPFLSPMICETLVTYYNGLGEAIPEAVCGSDTDLELHTPIGAYALCTASVRRALRTYSTGQYVATKQKFDQVNWGRSTEKMIKLLEKQDYKTWNLIFTQVARSAADVKKRARKARGVRQASAEDGEDSGSDIEVYTS